jgi:hypothetical protein
VDLAGGAASAGFGGTGSADGFGKGVVTGGGEVAGFVVVDGEVGEDTGSVAGVGGMAVAADPSGKPTTTITRPGACTMRCGSLATRSSTTRVMSGFTELIPTRTLRIRGSALRVTAGAAEPMPGKSRKMRGGLSTVPAVGAGSAPLPSIVTTASVPAVVVDTDLITTGAR